MVYPCIPTRLNPPNSAFISAALQVVRSRREGLERDRLALQVYQNEFYRQVTEVQNQVAQRRRDVNAGQNDLQRQEEILRNDQLTLELAQRDLANARDGVGQHEMENNALKEDLHRQREALLRKKEEMVKKETARRLRRWN